jgi:hypothetical protein
LRHDFLAEEGAPAPFNDVEVRVGLVGAVDGDVDHGMGIERGKGYACRFGVGLHLPGAGYPEDVAQVARVQFFGNAAQGPDGGRAVAQSDHHARLDKVDGGLGGQPLVFGHIVRHGMLQFAFTPYEGFFSCHSLGMVATHTSGLPSMWDVSGIL